MTTSLMYDQPPLLLEMIHRIPNFLPFSVRHQGLSLSNRFMHFYEYLQVFPQSCRNSRYLDLLIDIERMCQNVRTNVPF